MYPQHLLDLDTTRGRVLAADTPGRAATTPPAPLPELSLVLSGIRRAAPSGLRAGGLAAAVVVAVVIAVDEGLDTRVIVGRGGRRGSTTLGQLLADVAAGRDPWPASMRWVCAAVLSAVVLLSGSVALWAIRRHRRGQLSVAARPVSTALLTGKRPAGASAAPVQASTAGASTAGASNGVADSAGTIMPTGTGTPRTARRPVAVC